MSAPVSVPVATTAVILCSPATGVQFQIMNVGTQVCYVSNNSGVTSTTGFPLTPNSFINWYNAGPLGGAVYAICASGGTTVNVTGDAN
jgi:hypothetical protein